MPRTGIYFFRVRDEVIHMTDLIDERVRAILLDIEGTTTPIEFVHQTLFGYAKEHLVEFLERSSDVPEVHAHIVALRSQHAIDRAKGEEPPAWLSDSPEVEKIFAARYGSWLIERDSKIAPLKQLQGLIWREGYQSGRLKGLVFPDVPAALERWRERGLALCIYSSGSVLAQRLLFRTTELGDLTKYIVHFFDTQVGIKTDPASYQRIASLTDILPEQFLFLSDVSGELDAARSSGMRAVLVIRSNRSQHLPTAYAVIHTFDDLG